MGRELGNDWHRGVASALEWWRDAGVDTLVEDEVRDWLALAPARGPTAPAAAAVAAAAPEKLPGTLEAFVAWRLGADAPEAGWMAPLVPPAGVPGGLMILTDMPEPEDAAAATLLSGPAGRLLDAMLGAIGATRDSAYLAALAAARPLAGQIPADAEPRLAALARHHIGLVAPARLILLGQATKRVLATTSRSEYGNSGCDINQSGRNMEVAAIDAPRFLMKRPVAKSEAWKQLLHFSGGSCQ